MNKDERESKAVPISAEETQAAAEPQAVSSDAMASTPAETTEETASAIEQLQEGTTEATSEPMTTIPLSEYEALKQELERAQQSEKAYFEGWQRERADFINYKKRIEREQSQLAETIAANILKKYLVIVDDLERALKNRPTNVDPQWLEGIELIYKKLMAILEAEGVKRIPAEGAMFDPNLHEAISHDESPEHESGQIIEVVQQGYTIGDRVLRPALVRVAR
ncbi:nucleotide exchange factor GrpE [Thermanaerothrix sp. 4228-RoL]|jgi:molecular chaperone GrpE|uniref:Protein GrpE n=1 Tax=Thermanaerothrix solaris TaxID=3058434 RepID=A0ABU3NKK3_9CHLR|nr:nucleotide exchange factor GrpE [Thermanaerothrix sp. 4228-RoL]MDT8897383.1 nucleotide exchange factor GrpE [Thermanaerothrix sp. 4228-RoL]